MQIISRAVGQRVVVSVVSLVSILVAGTAFAEKSLEELLVEKGVITGEDLEALKDAEMKKGEEKVESEGVEPQADPNDLVEVGVGHKGLVVKSRDGRFKAAFGGRLQFDAGVFIQDRTSLGDGVEIRRARIKSYGTLWTDWDYKLEVNFDPDLEVPVTDGWLRYSGFKDFNVTIGHQKVPFGQSSMTSSNWQVFQERALSDAFIDNRDQGRRRMGVVLDSHGKMWSYAGGVFAGGLDDAGGNDEAFGTGHRFVFAPIAEKTKVLAMGGSVVYRNFKGNNSPRLRARPEAHLAGAMLVDTGVDNLTTVDDALLYNAEITAVAGRFHGQAEYTGLRLWRSSGDSALNFDGFYVQAGVFLTGESRNYQQSSGKYKRVVPANRRLGAWELAARFSQIDLSNGRVRGGVERNLMVALNWWVNQNILFRMNYIYGQADPNSGILRATPDITMSGRGEKIHGFTARAQVVF